MYFSLKNVPNADKSDCSLHSTVNVLEGSATTRLFNVLRTTQHQQVTLTDRTESLKQDYFSHM